MRLHYRDPQLRTAFAPWAPHPEALALAGLSGLTAALKFEAPCPNGVSTIPPHLDVLLERASRSSAFKSKCIESLGVRKAKLPRRTGGWLLPATSDGNLGLRHDTHVRGGGVG